ncbi:MAG: tetratricopeptide repeat protein [Actinomycetota bacterium]|nr:tetratricopeptide repeat protein [Actinomycetota bacterium]
MSLSSRIRQARMAKGLTQAQLAAPRYTHAYVSSIESGRRRPSEAALSHFASRLEMDAEELATGRPPGLAARLEMELQEARRKVSAGDFSEADSHYLRLGEQAAEHRLHLIEAKAVQGRALCAERTGDLEQAIELYESAEDKLGEESPIARADAIAGEARCLQMMGDTRYAAHVLEGLLETIERSGLREPQSLLRIHSSLVAAYFELGLYDKAAKSAETALQLSANVSDPEGLANMCINAARALLHQKRHEEAAQTLRRAEDLYRQLDFRSETASAYLAQGYIMARQGENEGAREKLQRAITLFEDGPNPIDEANAVNELARIERTSGNLQTARDLLQRSISLLKDNDVAELALAHRELGLCDIDTDSKVAEKNLRTSIELYERASEPAQLSATYRVLGDLLVKRGDARGGCDAYRTGIVALETSLGEVV